MFAKGIFHILAKLYIIKSGLRWICPSAAFVRTSEADSSCLSPGTIPVAQENPL